MADCVRQFSIDARGDYLLDRSPMMMTFKQKFVTMLGRCSNACLDQKRSALCVIHRLNALRSWYRRRRWHDGKVEQNAGECEPAGFVAHRGGEGTIFQPAIAALH